MRTSKRVFGHSQAGLVTIDGQAQAARGVDVHGERLVPFGRDRVAVVPCPGAHDAVKGLTAQRTPRGHVWALQHGLGPEQADLARKMAPTRFVVAMAARVALARAVEDEDGGERSTSHRV